ncbi:ABC transporter substrate-binding protein [Micromonospora sp. NPDC049900]|uniref:ABC transporter substrate-binding protein n=1 Tax=unclassified Micromonospora TaxID=2617518 RepID=UPI0037978709
MIKNRILLAGGVAAALLAVTACGSSEPDAATGDGPVPLRLTTLSLCNEIAQYALDTGLFAEHGLAVELIKTNGGSAGLAAVQSGSADIAFVNPVTTLTAIAKGVPVQVVSGSGLTTADTHGVIVANDSGINGPADLQGKRVAVNELGGSGQFLTTKWIERHAGAKVTAEFVALPFPELVAAVEGGQVDAAQVSATQVAQIVGSGKGRSIGNPIFDGTGPTPTAVYLATSDFIGKNEQTVRSFVAAMEQAAVAGNDPANDTEKFQIMEKYCKTPAGTLASIPEQEYEGLVNMDAMATIARVSHEGGLLDKGIDVTTIVPEFSRRTATAATPATSPSAG